VLLQVAFRGKNFGWDISAIAIHINELVCASPEWLSDSQIRCTPRADVVGAKNLTLIMADRLLPVRFFDFEEMYVSECKYNFYGLWGEQCVSCMRGGLCPGSEQIIDLVRSLPGFWRENLTVPDPKCSKLRWNRMEHGCPYLSACEPTWSCLGNNECAAGYGEFYIHIRFCQNRVAYMRCRWISVHVLPERRILSGKW
jgi:hypothetical protein